MLLVFSLNKSATSDVLAVRHSFWNQLALRDHPSTSLKGFCLGCNDLVPFCTKSIRIVGGIGGRPWRNIIKYTVVEVVHFVIIIIIIIIIIISEIYIAPYSARYLL